MSPSSKPCKIAGCVPAYNNEATIAQAVASLKAQTIPLDDIFVVDDGSTDATGRRALEAGARVVSMGSNQGRGAARARSIDATDAEMLLSVDGTAALAPDFLEKCLPWFEECAVAAVYGKITQLPAKNAVDRWRGRHLYRQDEQREAGETQNLITWGLVQRVSVIREIGNYDPTCRHSEDAELGGRVISRAFKVIYEPSATVVTLISNSLSQVLERYWRWNSGVATHFRLKGYLRMVWYSLKVLAVQDIRSRDIASAGISLIVPHYSAVRSWRGR